jgi:hypothetical protein
MDLLRVIPNLKLISLFERPIARASLQDAPALPIRKLQSSEAEIKGRGKSCMTPGYREGGMVPQKNRLSALHSEEAGLGPLLMFCSIYPPVDNSTPLVNFGTWQWAQGTRALRIRRCAFIQLLAVCLSRLRLRCPTMGMFSRSSFNF